MSTFGYLVVAVLVVLLGLAIAYTLKSRRHHLARREAQDRRSDARTRPENMRHDPFGTGGVGGVGA